MKQLFMINLDYFFQKNKKVITFLIIFIFVVVILFLLRFSNIFVFNSSSDLTGVVGTAIGAIIGGALALLGSIYVHNNQLKANAAITRKNSIYKPLFDELIVNEKELKTNPYPLNIEISKNTQESELFLEYLVWEQIKDDSRILQIPELLVEELELLNEKINSYKNKINQASEDVQQKIDEVLLRELKYQNYIQNMGLVLLSIIIVKEKPIGKILESIILKKEDRDVYLHSITRISEVEHTLYNECSQLSSVIELKKAYREWKATQNKIIFILTKLIKTTNIKYEKLRGIY